MNKVNLKALAYSVLLGAMLTFFVSNLNSDSETIVNFLITLVVCITACLIICINNKAIVHFMWKSSPEWLKPSDIWLCALTAMTVCLSAKYMNYSLEEGSWLSIPAASICICSALAYRYFYLRNQPDDLEQYEKNRQFEDEQSVFVTVAECKDSKSVQVIKNILEQNDIEVLVYGENMPGYLADMPIRVMVRRKDQETAEKLINE